MLRLFFRVRAFCVLIGAFLPATWRYRNVRQRLAFPSGIRLDERELRRFRHYYFGVTYLAAIMRSLRGRGRSHNEQDLFAQMAALACFFDDLTDHYASESALPPDAIADPETFGAIADRRGIALHLLQAIYQRLPAQNLPHFRAFMLRVFQTEISIEHPDDPKDLFDIHAEKGGCSVLLFRSLLNEPLGRHEENAWFQFGALVQLSDDIFDLWHDHQAGIHTPATQHAGCGAPEALATQFEQQALVARDAFLKTSFPAHRIETALGLQHILESITRVCLRHYLRLSRRHVRLPLEDRTLMVVDMQKLHNRLKVVGQWLYPIR
ncbi:MAG: hypothetical protein SFV22_06210 [Saprospiraceae bacterium]|nr:hypothetical protein [Saprospiraceae bacterium]